MQGIMKGELTDFETRTKGIFDRKDYFNLKRIDKKPNYVGEDSRTSELKPCEF